MRRASAPKRPKRPPWGPVKVAARKQVRDSCRAQPPQPPSPAQPSCSANSASTAKYGARRMAVNGLRWSTVACGVAGEDGGLARLLPA